MSVPWREVDENPNPTGGCVCYTANNPDQPMLGGYLNPQREFNDLGHQSPHVYICKGCINLPKDLLERAAPPVSVCIPAPPAPVEKPKPKRKAAPATD